MSNDSVVSVDIWGSGKPMREFLWSEDMADACVFLMEKADFQDTYAKGAEEIRNTHINIGTGYDVSIRDLAVGIKNIIGFDGIFNFDASKPDGTMKKLTDVSKLNTLGWKYNIELDQGVKLLYKWYLKNQSTGFAK